MRGSSSQFRGFFFFFIYYLFILFIYLFINISNNVYIAISFKFLNDIALDTLLNFVIFNLKLIHFKWRDPNPTYGVYMI